MDEHAQLRSKIAKLDRLASDKNPNVHERAAAKAKADKLRAKLPPEPQTDGWYNIYTAYTHQSSRQYAPQPTTRREQIEERVIYLNSVLHRLKPSGRMFAADLCSQWYSKGWLSEKQLRCVAQLIEEAEEGN